MLVLVLVLVLVTVVVKGDEGRVEVTVLIVDSVENRVTSTVTN